MYLDPAWAPSWPHVIIDWPDFGIPSDRVSLVNEINGLLDRARRGEIVEIGCLGGHGRTGTLLAILAVRAGEPASSAVAWVRHQYCHDAVETDQQAAFVESF
jgi:protein-tyrosine phosphatase